MVIVDQAVTSFHRMVYDHNAHIDSRAARESSMCNDKTDLFNVLTVLTIVKVAFAVFRGTSFFGLALTGLMLTARQIVNKSFHMGTPNRGGGGFQESIVLPRIAHRWGHYPVFLTTDTCRTGKWIQMTEMGDRGARK